jgi:hypothetical protein
MSEGMRSGVNCTRLKRRDHEGLREAGNSLEQAVPPREDRREELLDHIGLPDDHLLELFLHEPAVLCELLENVVDRLGSCGGHVGGRLRFDAAGRPSVSTSRPKPANERRQVRAAGSASGRRCKLI